MTTLDEPDPAVVGDSIDVVDHSERHAGFGMAPLLASIAVHAGIGFAAANNGESLVGVHVLVTWLTALVLPFRARRPETIMYVIAYVSSVDVLWRMTSAGGPWESSKLLVLYASVVGIYRFTRRLEPLAVLYSLFLLPSAVLTVAAAGLNEARDPLSTALAGVLAITAGVSFLSNFRVRQRAVRTAAYLAASPVTAIAIIVLVNTLRLDEESFGGGSSKAATGGFGPNQVSVLLGYGAVVLLLYAMREPRIVARVVHLLLAAGLLTQSAFTFSRGGIYNVAVAIVVALLLVTPRRRYLSRLLILLAVGLVVFRIFAPAADAFTGGALGDRFRDTESTGRDRIAADDVRMFEENPATGVGPGLASANRGSPEIRNYSPHTEFTRALAEHGLPGLIALIILAVLSVRLAIRRRWWPRAWSAGLLAWVFADMAHAAMRVGAVPGAFALAALDIEDEA